MKFPTLQTKKESALDTQVDPPQTLHWVVDEHEDLEAELNAIGHQAPEFSQGLIQRVVKRIEEL